LIVLPKNFEYAAFITVPPLHIAPFNFIMTLNFCLYFDNEKNRMMISWIQDDFSYEKSKKKLNGILGSNYMKTVEEITGRLYKEIFPISTCSDMELADDVPLKDDDECDIFLYHIFGIIVDKELKIKEAKEKRERKRAVEFKEVKEEYVAKVTMSYKTSSK
jgi:hypothetical protein